MASELRFWVDLRGQLSNPAARDKVDLAYALMAQQLGAQTLSHVALREARRPIICDVVEVGDMVQQFLCGETVKDLAARYSISESSVKRLLRANHVRRQR